MTSDFEGFSIPDFIRYIYFPILIHEKGPVFLFSMFSVKQGNYLVPFVLHVWFEAVLDWGLNSGPHVLDASTLPLGYRGGGGDSYMTFVTMAVFVASNYGIRTTVPIPIMLYILKFSFTVYTK